MKYEINDEVNSFTFLSNTNFDTILIVVFRTNEQVLGNETVKESKIQSTL